MGTICESITQKSSLKCYALSMLIGITYQFFLMRNEFWMYLLNISIMRENLIELNKEGLCSTIGYLAIYIGGNGICHKINSIRKEKK